MAKDGTARGGARPGSGPKKTALTEKISEGKAAAIIDLVEPADIDGEDMPPIKDYLKAKQMNGGNFCAAEVFEETWRWLRERGCEHLLRDIPEGAGYP